MYRVCVYLFTTLLALVHIGAAAQRMPLERIKLPPGFEISVFVSHLPNLRSLAVGKNYVFATAPTAGREHVVASGDTLGAIASKYGTNVDTLVRLNDFKDKNQTLNIGQKVKVP